MEKQKETAFGKEVYLLGTDKYGTKYWMEEPSWDCGWYWGFGYIETYQENKNPSKAEDIWSHSHFDLLSEKNMNLYDGFKEKFTDTPLEDEEIWQLCELMKTFYIMREYAEVLHRGDAHYTENPCKEVIKNDEEWRRINEVVLPEVFKEVRKILYA